MNYVERVLQPDETVLHAARLHWFIYLKAILLLILALVCVVLASGSNAPGIAIPLWIGAAVFGVVGAWSGLVAFIRQATTELALTDRRVIYKTGLFKRHTMEMNRSKVETVGVDQSVLGRLLNYGTVIVRGTGGSFEPIPQIEDPLRFRNRITAG
ncbi:MAG: PH domain-containing protein [Alphaproteobacteria bacterium]